MPIVINGSGTITGVSTGGLPDGCVDADTLAGNAVTSAKILDGTIANGDVNDLAASKLTGSLPAGMGGKILQVVNMKTSSEFISSSSTWADSNVTLSITPSATSSTVLILVTLASCGAWANDTHLRARLLRGSTEIHFLESLGGDTDSSAKNYFGSVSGSYLDSPSTTSSTTYKIQGSSVLNVSYAAFNRDNSLGDRGFSSMTLMEIGS